MLNLLNLLFSPVFVQTFIMTFLGEWGDRSQIATITLAAASGTLPLLQPHTPTFVQWLMGTDFWYVTTGTVIAHGCCTALAVVGGRLLASKISVRNGNSLPLIILLFRVELTFSYVGCSDFVPCIWSYICL